MVTATALVVEQQGAPFQQLEVELDALRPQEVLVKLVATGICHTDLAVQHGKIPVPFPVLLGHEGAGEVLKVGSEVIDLAIGDHVVLSYNFCDSCRSCKTKRNWHCTNIKQANFGGSRTDGSQTIVSKDTPIHTCFFGQSSFCNPAIVQAASCVKVKSEIPLSVACALGCGFQTGAGAVYNVVQPNVHKTTSLAVFGMGGVGCAAIMMARYLAQEEGSKLKTIIAVDINDQRLALAKELGATHTINSTIDNLEDLFSQLTAGEGVDAALDCTGVIKVVEQMIQFLGPGGRAVSLGGPPPGSTAAVDVFGLLVGAKSYQGCHQGNAYSKDFIPFLVELHLRGELPLQKLQTRFKATDINLAVDQMARGLVIKPVLLWDD